MTIQSDHKALIFLSTVAVLGVGVRAVRAAGRDTPNAQPALERQMLAADSSAAALAAKSAHPGVRGGRGRGSAARDTTRRARRDTTHRAPSVTQPTGALDRRGYIDGKLDLDVATAAQIDSLPGVTPTMAKRIVADRMQRGPFLTKSGLRRVSGVGDNFLRPIDTLITFSGTLVSSTPSDTVIKKSRNVRTQKPPVVATPPD